MVSSASVFADETRPFNPSDSSILGTDYSRSLAGLLTLIGDWGSSAEINHPDDTLEQVIARPILRMLLAALRYRDAGTMQHSRRVATLAVGLAKHLGWEQPDQKVLEVACLLHDVGKIGIPDNILFKPGRLNAEETRQMGLHWRIGTSALQVCGADLRVIEFIEQSMSFSEDDGMARAVDLSEIHLGARILAVSDAYDSLRNDQVFREGRAHGEILDILMKQAGSRFDGNVICTLARWIEHDGEPECVRNATHSDGNSSVAEDVSQAEQLATVFAQLYQVENQFDGFYLLDANQNIIVWSRGLQKLFNRPARNMLGRTWAAEMFGYMGELGQPLPPQEIPVHQVLQGQRPPKSALRMRQSDESAINVEIQTLPLLDANNNIIGVAELLKNLQQTQSLPDDYKELKLAATRDPLTSVANRKELETQLQLLFDDWNDADEPEPFCVIFLDIDFFKNINDTFGHTVGDQVLIDVSRLLRQESYSGELVGRYGGEEFVVLCPATTIDQAIRRAERLRTTIQNTKIGGLGNYRVTSSFGVAQVKADDSPNSLLGRADKALYQAKETGRNKVCSLTTESEAENGAGKDSNAVEDPFTFRTTFRACLGAEMIVYKLGGMVRDENAKLGEVKPNRVEVQFGSAGLLRFWGSSPRKQPVKALIEFENLGRAAQGQYSAAPTVEVKVTFRPVGVIRNAEVFQNRARHVLKSVRAYLQADSSTIS